MITTQMGSLYRQQLEAWLQTIDVKADKVLDIGGSANPVKGRTKSWDVKTYEIMDDGSEQYRHDKWVEPDYNVNIESILLGWKLILAPTGYDCVFMLEVAEYLFNPVFAMHNIVQLLKPEGVAYVSFPAIYPVHEPIEADNLRYTRGWIERMAKEKFSEYEIIPRTATHGKEALQDFYSQEGMRAVKNNDVIYDIGYMCKFTK